MNQTGKLVIIGSGIAGLSAARAARRRYPHLQIEMISAAPTGFYNRIALGAYVTQKRTEAELHTFARHLFKNERIETRFGTQVERIVPKQKQLILADSSVIPYDKLILATGARPVVPPIAEVETNAVFPLWTLEDAHSVKTAIATADRVTVIGGGVLGVEAAMDFAQLGKQVQLVETAPALLSHLLLADTAPKITRELERQGITVITNNQVREITGQRDGLHVTLSDRTIQSDAVLLSVGVTPNIQLAQQADLRVERGIWIDETLHTSDPHILACGNCAVQPEGGALLWNPAKEQGTIAGENAFFTYKSLVMRPAPVHLKSETLPLFILGHPKHISFNARCIRETDDTRNTERTIYVSPDGRIEYVVMLGDVTGYYELEKWFRHNRPLPADFLAAASVSALLASLCPQPEEPQFTKTSWMCDVCGYTHEGNQPPHICPVCSVGKDQFLAA